MDELFCDYYQFSMAYSYWKIGKHNQHAVFNMYFRKNPFDGEYTIFAGLNEVLDYIENFKFTDREIELLDKIFHVENKNKKDFYKYLKSLNPKQLKIEAVEEGRIVFPNLPLISISGPLAFVQLLETKILNICNFACLVATNARRLKFKAGDKLILELGARRAQGKNGALCASKYSYIGGVDGSSNVLSSIINNIPCSGTHAHSFVTSFQNENDVTNLYLKDVNLLDLVKKIRKENNWENTNIKELYSFIGYAYSFPDKFISLIDTYKSLESGIYNFLSVALALDKLGYKAIGVRIDSGDLAYVSVEIRKIFNKVSKTKKLDYIKNLKIIVSNDIDEKILETLKHQDNEIDIFGIGTNLVTCKGCPSLGMVFKLVEIEKNPVIKLSDNILKTNIPYDKNIYRFYDKHGEMIIDLLTLKSETIDSDFVLCRHPLQSTTRARVSTKNYVKLNKIVWNKYGRHFNKLSDEIRELVNSEFENLREDHKRRLNSTQYKVALSSLLYTEFHKQIESNNIIAFLD